MVGNGFGWVSDVAGCGWLWLVVVGYRLWTLVVVGYWLWLVGVGWLTMVPVG